MFRDNSGNSIYANSFTPSFNLKLFISIAQVILYLKYFHIYSTWTSKHIIVVLGVVGEIYATPPGWIQNVIVVDSLISIQSNDSISICVGQEGVLTQVT